MENRYNMVPADKIIRSVERFKCGYSMLKLGERSWIGGFRGTVFSGNSRFIYCTMGPNKQPANIGTLPKPPPGWIRLLRLEVPASMWFIMSSNMGIDTHMDFGNCSGCLRLVKISGTRLRSSSKTMLLTILRKFEASIDNCPEPNEKTPVWGGLFLWCAIGVSNRFGAREGDVCFSRGMEVCSTQWSSVENLLSLESDVGFVTLRYWRLSLSIMDIMGNPMVTSQHLIKGRRFGPPPWLVPVVQGSRRSTCFIPMVSQGHSGPPKTW